MLQQKLRNAKSNVKSNAKHNAKKASELWEKKKAENDALVAQGIGIDAALRPDVVETIALKVVKKIETIVDEDGKVYVCSTPKLMPRRPRNYGRRKRPRMTRWWHKALVLMPPSGLMWLKRLP